MRFRKSMLVVLCAVALSVIPVPSVITEASSSSILLEDSFDTGIIGPSWTIVQGSWEAVDGQLYTATVSGSGASLPIIKAGDFSWSSYTLEFDYTPSYQGDANGCTVYAFICNQRDDVFYEEYPPGTGEHRPVTGYVLDVGFQGEMNINRCYSDGIEISILASADGYPLTTGTTYTVKFGRDGALVKAKIWDKGTGEPDWQLTANDSSYLWGKIALGTWQTRGYFDNVRVYGTEVPSSPVAYIDSISPDPGTQGLHTVNFEGHGTDADGAVVGYSWRSSIDGQLSTSASFSKPASQLSTGTHTIYFKVQDNDGVWSTEDAEDLTIDPSSPVPQPPTGYIDSISPSQATQGETVSFSGHGTDTDGSVTDYSWRSSIDGQLSTSSSFSEDDLSVGTHTIYFKVQDDDELWSGEVSGTVVIDPSPDEFRQGPVVRIRPLTDKIDSRTDGLVELFLSNPSLNEVTLNGDFYVSVPSGIYVYGEGLGLATAAGTAYGQFSVPPGTVRTFYINIKADDTAVGTSPFIQCSGQYWPGDNKDAYNVFSLTHPFEVVQASPNPYDSAPTNPPGGIWMGWWIILAVVVLGGIAAIVAVRSRRTEVNVEK